MKLRWPLSLSAFVTPAAGVLLVQPLQALWLNAAGQTQPVPPPADQPVRVVADLIEETHVVIEVPPLMGSDRSGFIQVQLQSLLPEVPLQAMWQTQASHPWLPKAFQINAVGVASQALQTVLDEAVAQQRPVQGVWPLSYLMAQWAGKQAALKSAAWLLLCLALPHGLRMVLLKQGVPVFSRLLLDLDPQQQALEISLTLKYLTDNRVLDRTVQPGVVLMQPDTVLALALKAYGVVILPPVASASAHGVLADVLALANGNTPGQLAFIQLRQHFLLRQARRGVALSGGMLALVGVWMVAYQGQVLISQMEQTSQWQQQASQKAQAAQVLQQSIAASGVDTSLMRLAIEVHQRELQGGIDLPAALLQLGKLIQSQPQADLVRTELSLLTTVCKGVRPHVDTAAAGTAHSPILQAATDGNLKVEWQFEIRPTSGVSLRTRQQMLDELGKIVRTWSHWQVYLDPVQSASGAVIASNQASSGPGAEWRWCLSPTPKPAGQPS